ncbi:NACHT domain-containing protein [Kibdelosporangium aridum]|uniref:NACHT domain-containing protein n=1 Tax=Kibdelosporangium aridum TaxID=2030 RepID=UPI0005253850
MKSSKFRKVLTVAVIVFGVLIIVGTVLSFVHLTLSDNNSLAGIVSGLVGLITGFAAVLGPLLRKTQPPQVPDEARALVQKLLEQWTPEIKRRRRQFDSESRVIPLIWRNYQQRTVTPPTNAATTRIKDGRLDRNPDKAEEQLADAFNNIPNRRLVMLGEPGAGKTFLGITLTVGLLHQYTDSKPIPIFLSLSSWDPVTDGLDDWIIDTMAAKYYGGSARVPRALLANRLILPVLDGLDEIPEHLRRRAIREINEILEGDRPLVLTCRSAEYEDGLAGGAPVLLRSPVVEIGAVTIADVQAHLSGNPAWAKVVRHIESDPHGALATALTTPLMLSLFTAAYRDRDPEELLDTKWFDTRHAVEDQLVDVMVESAYPPDENRRWLPWRPWTSGQATRWLAYLASYLHSYEERDLTLWNLARRKQSIWAALVAVAAALAILVLIGQLAVFAGLTSASPTKDLDDVISTLPFFGTLLGLALTGTIVERRGGFQGERPFRRYFRLALTCIATTGFAVVLSIHILLSERTGYRWVVSFSVDAAQLAAQAILTAGAVGLYSVLLQRADTSAHHDPRQFLRRNRRIAVRAAAVSSLLWGITCLIVTAIAGTLGGHFGQRIARLLAMPTKSDLQLPALSKHVGWAEFPDRLSLFITASIVITVTLCFFFLTTHPSLGFLAARINLAVTRRLPWRIIGFLEDAHHKGLLRRVGASYQFWHISMQERLATPDRYPKPDEQSLRRRRLITAVVSGVVLTTSVVLVAANEPPDCSRTDWPDVDRRMQRVDDHGDSFCFVAIDWDDWTKFPRPRHDGDLLNQIRSAGEGQRALGTAEALSVLGDFVKVDTRDWREILQGLIVAQAIHDEVLIVKFIHVDNEGDHEDDRDLNALSRRYIGLGYAGGISIDTAASDVPAAPMAEALVAIQNLNYARLAEDFRDNYVDYWLASYNSDERPSDAELQTISTDGCKAPKPTSLRYDFRNRPLDTQVLARLNECGTINLLVSEQQRSQVPPLLDRFPNISFYRVDNRSDTIPTQCSETLGQRATPQSLSTCVAALASANDFRVQISQIYR